jgi:hypothetical protein
MPSQERGRHRTDLAVGSNSCASLEQGVVGVQVVHQGGITGFRECGREATLANVVCAAFDRERAQLRIPEKTRGGGNVFSEQLILEKLGSRR